MPEEYQPRKRSWPEKFRETFHGLWVGVRGQSSFSFHFVATIAVIVAGIVLKVTRVEWYILILCITSVLTAEMFNSALEVLAKAVDKNRNQYLADSLNISSAAVLVTSIGSSLTGAIIFIHRLGIRLEWWVESGR